MPKNSSRHYLLPLIGSWSIWPSTTRCRSTRSQSWSAAKPSPRRVAGAVVVDGDQVWPAHPLFVDAVRDAMGGPELRRLRTELVERLGAAPPRDVVDLLRLAVLALDGDRPQPTAELVKAAQEALRLGDLELSEQLGRAALERAAGLPARLTLAYHWRGRAGAATPIRCWQRWIRPPFRSLS